MRFPLLIAVQDSRRLRAAYFFLQSLAALAILALPTANFPPFFKLAGLVLLAGLAWQTRPQVHGLVALSIQRDNSLRCRLQGDPAEQPLACERLLVCSPWLVVCTIRIGDAPRSQVLTLGQDSLSPDDFRRLRVWLRHRPDEISAV